MSQQHEAVMDRKRRPSLLALVGLLGLTATVVSHASPLFEGSGAGVWVYDAEGSTRSYHTGGWVQQASAGSGSVTLTLESEQTVSVPLPGSGVMVLINETLNSLPGVSAQRPGLSLVGLSAGAPVAAGTAVPQAAVQPAGGSYGETLRLDFSITPSAGSDAPLTLHWRVDRDGVQGSEQTRTLAADEAHHAVYLLDSGSYQIRYWASQDGVQSQPQQAGPYQLNIAEPAQRDTDGDGLPDRWEIANGMDPLSRDLSLDSDGDGWTDFEERLRGSDPLDADSLPVDSDGDGWSDFDERLRGTDPNDDPGAAYPDRPRARRLREVEYLLQGSAYTDAAETTPQSDLAQLQAYSLDWQPLYRQRDLPDAEELSALGLSEADLPAALRAGAAATALAQGQLPAMRLPAGDPIILRSGHADAQGELDAWAVKRWVDSAPDLHPGEVTAWLQGQGKSWSDPAQWQQAYEDYLAARLVRSVNADLSPATTAQVALFEGVLDWLDGDQGQGLVLLGTERGLQPAPALARLRQLLGGEQRSFNALAADLAGLPALDPDVQALYDDLLAVYADLGALSGTDATRAAASRVAQASAAARYPLALLALQPLQTLQGMDSAALAVLLDPAADADADGLQNAAELLFPGPDYSRPDQADSDGDSLNDAADACPREAANSCVTVASLGGDSDGDGVLDGLDNCPALANPAQADSDGYARDGQADGIGDACAANLLAAIIRPGADITLPTGARIAFAARPTETGAEAGTLFYDWDFGGASPATAAGREPGEVHFPQAGSYQVALTVSGDGEALSTDRRTITVSGDAPALPQLTVSGESLAEGDQGERTGLFYLQLSAPAPQAVTLDYRVTSASASAGDDYRASAGRLTIPAGQSQALVAVTVLGDRVDEANEVLRLELSKPVGVALPATSATLTIEDDDAEPLAAIAAGDGDGSTVAAREGEAVAVMVGLIDAAEQQGTVSTLPVTIEYTLSGTADGADYSITPAGTVTLPAGESLTTLQVALAPDQLSEGDETVVFTLVSATNAGISTGYDSVTLTIQDVAPIQQQGINDTGVEFCGDSAGAVAACPVDGLPNQDAELGRDVDAAEDADGRLGFSFIKRDSTGAALDQQDASYAESPWACVEDRVTGLSWQVTDVESATQTFSWYQPDAARNGGDPGVANGGNCWVGKGCDTAAYAAYVNAGQLCGYSDWRLPTRNELASLLDLGLAPIKSHQVAIDKRYFPFHAGGLSGPGYWTADSVADNPVSAWYMNFGNNDGRATLGSVSYTTKSTRNRVILVRGGN